ncbi:MAG: hypothetical protein A4E66_00682 [Syntrophus sp. PtaB.Bin001]|nr:MAG: hypothetical protein A4E66_00682 [Syntrophus sp. PtaB.Bin001]
MKYSPLPFSGPMIRALDHKTVTRRTRGLQEINKNPDAWSLIGSEKGIYHSRHTDGSEKTIKCPFGVPGDRFWVKESCYICGSDSDGAPLSEPPVVYAADGATISDDYPYSRPSIFMPRWASRFTLEATGIRVERLQDITAEDAIREGARFVNCGKNRWGNLNPGWSMHDPHPKDYRKCLDSARLAFANYWNLLNEKKYPWSLNPWVWPIEFKKI